MKHQINRILIGLVAILIMGIIHREILVGNEPKRRSQPNSNLVEEFKSAKYFWEQLAIGKRIVRQGDSTVISRLEKLLNHPDRHLRCNAAFVLAGLGDERGFRAIIAVLQDTEPRSNKDEGTLWRYQPPESWRQDTGIEQITEDRYYAVTVLGELKDRRAVPILVGYLTDENINCHVAVVLAEIGDKQAVPGLKQMLSHKNRDRRLWAAYGLAKLGDPLGVPIVAEFLEDPQWVQRRHAAEALGTFGDRRAVPALLAALKDKQSDICVSAAKALGKLGDEHALTDLKRLLADYGVTTTGPTITVQEAAEQAIRLIQARKGAP